MELLQHFSRATGCKNPRLELRLRRFPRFITCLLAIDSCVLLDYVFWPFQLIEHLMATCSITLHASKGCIQGFQKLIQSGFYGLISLAICVHNSPTNIRS